MSHGATLPNINPIGGPIGNMAPIPMANNGAMGPPIAAPPGVGASPAGIGVRSLPMADRTQLNKYIYDYFLRSQMWDCARALLNADSTVGTKVDDGKNGNFHNNALSEDAMDTDSKDDMDQKSPEDLPPAAIGNAVTSDSAFLYDWFCLFWDLYHAQRHKNGHGSIHQYVGLTQAQSRLKQSHQQDMLRQMRPDGNPINMQHMHPMQLQAMRMQGGGPLVMNMKQGGNLARTAMANNQNPQQAIQLIQAKQGHRDSAELEAMRQRASSPGSENAASPSKRPRLEGGPFHPNQPNMLPGGRPGQGIPGQDGAVPNSAPAHVMMMPGISPQGLAPAQMQQNFLSTPQGGQAKSIQSYSQSLQQHHGSQMPNKQMTGPGGPPNQGSPGIPSQTPEINAYYNAPGTIDVPGRMGQPGAAGGQPGASNHALQDYQMQLMLLEQQNKKRLLMARQEQDNIGPMGRDGSGGPVGPPIAGPNGQFPDASPQAARPGASPNPTDQMKRGAPQINNVNMPSPLPEGAQSRGSPNSIPFNMGGPIDANAQQPQQQFNMVQMANGMRPPGPHLNQPLNGAMPPQQQHMMARQQQQQPPQQPQQGLQHQGPPPSAGGPGGPQGQWQPTQAPDRGPGGPNGAQMVPPSASQSQMQGTPQLRPMVPPPSVVGGTSASPVMPAHPPTPKVRRKDGEPKGGKNAGKGSHHQKKGAANASTRPAGEGAGETEPPPATPITPANPVPFSKASAGPAVGSTPANGPPGTDGTSVPGATPTPPVAPQNPDLSQGTPAFGMDTGGAMVEFPVDFGNGLTNGPMMEDFDFESFLHDESGEAATFDFNATFGNLEGTGEIGTTE